MSDIVERLARRITVAKVCGLPRTSLHQDTEDARDEILRLRAALEAERERCAKVADLHSDMESGGRNPIVACRDIAAAIRSLQPIEVAPPSDPQSVPGYTLDKATMTYTQKGGGT